MLNRFVTRTWLPESFVGRAYVLNPFVSFCKKDFVARRTAVEAVLSIPDTFCRHWRVCAPFCRHATRAFHA